MNIFEIYRYLNLQIKFRWFKCDINVEIGYDEKIKLY